MNGESIEEGKSNNQTHDNITFVDFHFVSSPWNNVGICTSAKKETSRPLFLP
jgi:hypothetical protein